MTTRGHWVHELAVQRGISVKTVEVTLQRAPGAAIVPEAIDHVRKLRDESLRLFLAGKEGESLWCGQAMWDAAARLNTLLELRPEVARDRKRQAGTKAPRLVDVQAEIDKLVRNNREGLSVEQLYWRFSEKTEGRLGISAFRKRVTAARDKLLRSK